MAEPTAQKIRSYLAGRIRSGEISVGTRLPSAEDLATQWGVTANTARRALGPWRDAGIVSRYGAEVLRIPDVDEDQPPPRRDPAPLRLDRAEAAIAELQQWRMDVDRWRAAGARAATEGDRAVP